MTTEAQTIAEFIRRHMLPMSVSQVDHNRNMPDSSDMDHWRCTLRAPGGKRMRVTFSQGRGHHGAEPELDSVLNCLASDASVDGMTFADFCDEYGYDEDSRKDFRTFRQCVRQTDKLKALLGQDLFAELLNCDRL